jgi:DNA-binding MarR family transcriptional regulator
MEAENMSIEPQAELVRELLILEKLEADPDINQASIAALLGVAVGTVNWHIRRFVEKGYIKVKRAQRRKLRYIITPEGIAFRARLTMNYIEQSMRLYRRIRQRTQELLSEVQRAGFRSVQILGNDDIADICRLTCLEQGISIADDPSLPALEIDGTQVNLKLDGR